jgi:DNA polymerase-3 subunit alpha
MQKIKGIDYIVEGLNTIKNVGVKASAVIENERIKNGKYTSLDNFISRVPKRSVNIKTIKALTDCGALEFNKEKIMDMIEQYNKNI